MKPGKIFLLLTLRQNYRSTYSERKVDNSVLHIKSLGIDVTCHALTSRDGSITRRDDDTRHAMLLAAIKPGVVDRGKSMNRSQSNQSIM